MVSHDAFSYLDRFGLKVEGIAGLSPDAEPTPADLARLQELIDDDGITTVFSERLVSPRLSQTLADDMGITTAVLDPIEGLSDETADEDYLSLMRENLAALEEANGCLPAHDQQSHRCMLTDGAVAIGGRPVLRGIDLTVESGEFVALMGANGSGKSTLVRALTGLLPLTAGSLELFGTPFDQFDDWRRDRLRPPARRRRLRRTGLGVGGRGVRPAHPPPAASGRSRRPTARAIDEALAVVGLADRARDGVSTLSGGQQQRTLIARALAGEPELFFLDEPTAGVDLPNQLTLADVAARSSRTRGATIVLVAHELGPLAAARRPRRGDARRTGRLRRRAARRPRRPRPGLRRAARAPSPPRAGPARPRAAGRSRRSSSSAVT